MIAKLRLTTIALLCLGLAACSSPPPNSLVTMATPLPLAFQGTISSAAAALTGAGFSCNPDVSPRPSMGTPLDLIETKPCQKPVANGQGTFLTLYGRTNDGTIVGLDIMTDQAGPTGAASPEVRAALVVVFPVAAVSVVQNALADPRANGAPIQLTPAVRVRNLSRPSPNGLLNLEIWGPAVVAASSLLK